MRKETIEGALLELLRSEPNEVEGMLEVLEEHKIRKEVIEGSLKVLAKGKAKKEKMDRMLNAFENHGISKETIENNLSALVAGYSDDIDETLTAVMDFGISLKAIENSLIILSLAKADEVKERIKVIKANKEYKIGPDDVERCMTILVRNKADEITRVLKVLKAHNISEEALKKCLYIVAVGKADEVEKVLSVLENPKHNIDPTRCLTVVAYGKAEQVEELLTNLKDYGISKEAILNCLSILRGNDLEKIKNALTVLKKHDIRPDTIERCLTIFASGNSKRIDDILTVLEEYKISKASIENCLSILILSNSRKIGKVLEKLTKNGVSKQAIEENLSLLAEAIPDEIEGILRICKKNGIPIEENLRMFSKCKARRLEEVIRTLKENKVRQEIIVKEIQGIVLNKNESVEAIFDDEKVPKDRKVHLRCIRKYMQLKEMYGKSYTKEEIEEICTQKHITIEEFIREIACRTSNNAFAKLYYDKVMAGGKLYVGPSKPIDNEYLEANTDEILDMARIAAIKFMRMTGESDFDELQSAALEIIVNKCGNLIDNLQNNHDALRGSVINKASKFLYAVGQRQKIYDNEQIFSSDYPISGIDDKYQAGELKGVIDYKKAEFNEAEEEIMELMVRLVEEGEADELYKKIAKINAMDEDEVMGHIHSIRQKLLQKKLVKEGNGYEFCDGEEEK